jgi:hypothetical protein
MQRNSIILLQYAGFLLVVGLASAFYSAADRTAGWNPHGKSGLIACGSAAVVAAVFGWLTGKRKEWAAWAGLALSFILLAYGGSTLFSTVRDVSGLAAKVAVERGIDQAAAERTILYKAAIFGAMFVFSVSAFLRLGFSLRRGGTA